MVHAFGGVGALLQRLANAPRIFLQSLLEPDEQNQVEQTIRGQLNAVELSDGWENGLTHEQARKRLEQHGLNHYRPLPNKWKVFGEQFKSVAAISLLAFAGLAWGLGKYFDTTLILLVFAAQAIYTTRVKCQAEQDYQRFLQEQKTVSVIRGGQISQIAPTDVVPGDVLFLRQGDVVPADAFITCANHLQVREMDADSTYRVMLKCAVSRKDGESCLRINRGTEANRLYAGSVIVSGSAQAVVTHTGDSTRHADILRQPKRRKLYTEQRYDTLSKKLTKAGWIAIILVGGLVFLVGWSPSAAVATASAVATSVIPGGFSLPICLAFWTATKRMRQEARELPSLHHVDRLEDTKVVVLTDHGLTDEMEASQLFGSQSRWFVSKEVSDHIHSHKRIFHKDGIQAQLESSSEAVLLIQAAKPFARINGDLGPYDRAVNRLYGNLPVTQRTDPCAWKWIDHAHLQSHGLFEMRAFQDQKGRIVEVIRGPVQLLFEKCKRAISPKQMECSFFDVPTMEKSDALQKSLQDWLETARRHHEQTVGFAYRIREAEGMSVHSAGGTTDVQDLIWIGAISFQCIYQRSSHLLRRVANLGLPVVLTVQESVIEDPGFRQAITFDDAKIRILSTKDFVATLEEKPLEKEEVWIVVADERERLDVLETLRERYSAICFIGCHDQERALFGAAWAAIEQGIKRGLQDVIEALEETGHARARLGHANGFILSGNIGEVVFSTLAGITGAHHALSPVILNLLTNSLASVGIAIGKREVDQRQGHPNGDLQSLHKPIVSHGFISGATAMLAYAGGLLISEDPFFASTFAFITLILSQLWQAVHWRRQSRLAKLSDLWEDRVLTVSLLVALLALVLSVQVPFFAGQLQTTPLGIQDWLAAGAIAGAVGPVASNSEEPIWGIVKRVTGRFWGNNPQKPMAAA
ncbi:hypothetical protein DNHGIG_18630 [Collibacillus ludicampi]|uniref:Cation-transporting P-type ATPase N-terminal domain-containing protein n=1 Tax=Collibacillus ludicampi TaxID=2771369 RepID=A0AAV4LFL9_9BACL|nr:cation transporting ATPase C-terminal domain-containing protein [Collibacillus ludicampi]GIM46314.1 hypothetical protein DNHGIG_18630 [Collibacillus ludicampi]